jgi:hypothetical protein
MTTRDDSLGLSLDMLDVDRLRLWANRFADYGPDVTHWGSVEFIVAQLRALADRMEEAISDIGKLRQGDPSTKFQGEK